MNNRNTDGLSERCATHAFPMRSLALALYLAMLASCIVSSANKGGADAGSTGDDDVTDDGGLIHGVIDGGLVSHVDADPLAPDADPALVDAAVADPDAAQVEPDAAVVDLIACDPITQKTADDTDATFCGEPLTPDGKQTMQCVSLVGLDLPTNFVCMPVVNPDFLDGHKFPAGVTPAVNDCGPRSLPLYTQTYYQNPVRFQCVALCIPAPTSEADHAHYHGIEPLTTLENFGPESGVPYDRECRYWWMLEGHYRKGTGDGNLYGQPAPVTPYTNTLGFRYTGDECKDGVPGQYFYEQNGCVPRN